MHCGFFGFDVFFEDHALAVLTLAPCHVGEVDSGNVAIVEERVSEAGFVELHQIGLLEVGVGKYWAGFLVRITRLWLELRFPKNRFGCEARIREVGGLRERGAAEVGGLRERGVAEVGGLRERGAAEVGGLRERGVAEVGGLRERGADEVGGLRERGEAEVGGLRERGAGR